MKALRLTTVGVALQHEWVSETLTPFGPLPITLGRYFGGR